MNSVAKPCIRFARTAIVVLLVAAQSLAIAHEFSHGEHAVQDVCATCSLSTNLESSVTAEHQHGPVPNDVPFRLVPVAQNVRIEVHIPYAQRAPPISP